MRFRDPAVPPALARGVRVLGVAVAVTAAATIAGCAVATSTRAGATAPALSSRADAWITIGDFRRVIAVAVSERVVYFGTTAGLERWDTLRQTWLPPLTAADGLPDDRVTALVAEPLGGDLWIGTRRGLAHLGAFGDVVEPVWGPLAAPVETLLLDTRDGTVYARMAGGWWSGRGASFTRAEGLPSGPLEGSMRAEELDPTRVPWIDPLYARGADSSALFRLTEVDRDLRGDWYAGTWGDNGRRWSVGAAAWDPLLFGLGGPGGGPIARAVDGYWFTAGPGDGQAPASLAHAAPDLGAWSYVVPREEPELPTAVARAVLALGDTLVVGSDFGLAWGSGPDWRHGGHDGKVGEVTALALDGGVLWVGTRDGLLAWDRGDWIAVASALAGRRVTALAVTGDALFVGAEEGLWTARRGAAPQTSEDAAATADSLVRVEPRGRRVRALATHANLLLVGTDVGLEVFDRESGLWHSISGAEGRLDGAPLAIASDGENVWVGTERGLVRWRPATDEWRTYGPGDGLGGIPVLHLLAEEDAVWASTPAGISRFAWRAAEP